MSTVLIGIICFIAGGSFGLFAYALVGNPTHAYRKGYHDCMYDMFSDTDTTQSFIDVLKREKIEEAEDID